MAKLFVCPTCNGTGTIQYTVSVYGSPEKTSKHKTSCYHCGSTGKVTQEQCEQIEWEKAQWCQCNPEGREVKFYDDYVHPEFQKHHWRCRKCGFIVQIG